MKYRNEIPWLGLCLNTLLGGIGTEILLGLRPYRIPAPNKLFWCCDFIPWRFGHKNITWPSDLWNPFNADSMWNIVVLHHSHGFLLWYSNHLYEPHNKILVWAVMEAFIVMMGIVFTSRKDAGQRLPLLDRWQILPSSSYLTYNV